MRPAALADFVEALAAVPELHSLLVVRRGHVVAEAWADPYAPDRPHMLFSLSKSFTSAAVGLAVSEGLLGYDDLLLDHFADLAPAEPSAHLRAVRVRHLLTMTVGHDVEVGSDVLMSTSAWVRAFLAHPVPHEPGTHFLYNTAATYVLSALVQRVTGHTLGEYLRPLLYEPLGMEGVTWETSPEGVHTGGYGMSATTEDVAAFGVLLLQDGVWQGRRVLPEGWVAEATARQVPNGDGDGDWSQGYGYQFWRCRHGAYRGDGAFGQYCVVLPDQETVVVTTSAAPDMAAQLDLVWDRLLPALADGPVDDDPAGRARLEERLDAVRIPLLPGDATSPEGDRLSGRVCVVDDADGRPRRGPRAADRPADAQARQAVDAPVDPGAILAFVLTTAPAADRLVVTFEHGSLALDIGHDDPLPGYVPATAAHAGLAVESRGVWTAPDTYVLAVRAVDGPFVVTLRLVVDGETVRVESGVNVAFGPTTFPPLTARVQA